MPTHTQVPLEYNGRAVGIDEGLVPLIRALWALGIRTTNCCQGTEEDWHSGYLAIDGRDFGRFLDLFEDAIELASNARGLNLNAHEGCRTCLRGWHSGMAQSFDTALYHDGEQFVLSVALRFAPSFVPTLTQAALDRLDA